MFEFLRPDKSPQNARMPKRLNTLKRKKRQPTHTPHPHNEKAPRSFANTTIAHSKFLMCIDAKFPHALICTPKFRNTPKSKVSDYPKQPSKFRNVYPSPQTDTLQFPILQNHLLRSQKVTKRHPELLYAHEVREFRTIQRPNAPQPNTHTTPPKHFEVSDYLQNPHLSRENFTPWELDLSTARATANEHHILLTSSVSAPHAVYNVALLLRRRGTCSCTSSRPRTTAVNSSFVRLVAPLHFGRAIKHIIAKVA